MAARGALHIVTGKGGVGKTTLAIALAEGLAAEGKRVCLLELGPGLGLSAALGEGVCHEPRSMGERLEVLSTDAARAVDEAVLGFSPSRRAATRLLRVGSLRAFLGAAPGVVEVALLHRIDVLRKSGAYDALVIDADSTGHARMLLDAPDVLRSIGAAGPVLRTLDEASRSLSDPSQTQVHVVTLPTALALEETAELLEVLAKRRAPLGTLYVARATVRRSSPHEIVEALHARAVGAPPAEDLDALAKEIERRERLDRFLAREGPRFRRTIEVPVAESVVTSTATANTGAAGTPSDPIVPAACAFVLVVGVGGVGKTTVAAAIGARAAHEGRRVLVLTVDPARRLASALGVALGDAASVVPLPTTARGSLSAAMLETGDTFDALVARIVLDPEARAAILGSPTYRGFSRTLARSHAYAALERVHALVLSPDPLADLVVLDTPPGAAALDLLDAPTALARFADDRVVSILTGAGASVLVVGMRALFSRLAGARVARELAEFLGAFLPARQGFVDRARDMETLLRSRAHRLLVVAPDEGHLREAAALAQALRAREIAPHAAIVNRARARISASWSLPRAHETFGLTPGERVALTEAHELGERERAADLERARVVVAFHERTGIPIARALALRAEEPTSSEALLDLMR